MPHEGYATPSVNDGLGFHSDVPVSELTERDTRAIEASVVSSAPLVVETKDRMTHEIHVHDLLMGSVEPSGGISLLPNPPPGRCPSHFDRLRGPVGLSSTEILWVWPGVRIE